jgi:hypothetical protein
VVRIGGYRSDDIPPYPDRLEAKLSLDEHHHTHDLSFGFDQAKMLWAKARILSNEDLHEPALDGGPFVEFTMLWWKGSINESAKLAVLLRPGGPRTDGLLPYQ